MKEKVILLFKIPSDHLEICNPVIYDVREIFFDEPNKNEKARKKLITSNVSHVQNTMSKISTIVNICYKKIEPKKWILIFPGQIESTIQILIFPGQIELTIWILILVK